MTPTLGGPCNFGRSSLVAMIQVGRDNSGTATCNSNNGVPHAARFSNSLLGATLAVAGTTVNPKGVAVGLRLVF